MDEKLAKINHYIDLLQEKLAIKWLSEKEERVLEKLQEIRKDNLNEGNDSDVLNLVWDTLGSIWNTLWNVNRVLDPITDVLDILLGLFDF